MRLVLHVHQSTEAASRMAWGREVTSRFGLKFRFYATKTKEYLVIFFNSIN